MVAWKSVYFAGSLKFANSIAIAVDFISRHNDSAWTLWNVCGPCTLDGKREFITWLKGIDINHEVDWIILGDFNLYRYPENRNREGADHIEMFLFNSAISHLGLTEIPLQGKKNLLGQTCRALPCLRDWIGCLPTIVGLLHTLKLPIKFW